MISRVHLVLRMERTHYCVNCDTYFCQMCVVHHNKVFKSHKLLDKDAMAITAKQTKKKQRGVPLPTKECEEHPGNIVQMFCGTHDVCCCTVCIALEHRACKNVDFVPKLAKGILQSKERQSAKSCLEQIQGELLQLKSKKEDELAGLKKTKQDILEEIQQQKERLIVRVNELERKSRDEVCEIYENITGKVNNDIETLNDLLRSAESHLKRIDRKQSNGSELFIAIKYGQKFELAYKPIRQQVEQDNVTHLSFVASKDMDAFLDSFDSLGAVNKTEYDHHLHQYSATLTGEYNVKVSEDKETCSVYDLCVLDDGQYIITDFTNDKIKRLDKTFSVTDWCTVPGPWGLCKTGTNEVAVTSFNKMKVHFISIGRNLLDKRSFEVRFKGRGIKYNDDKLFIGGSPEYNQKCTPDEIKVYSLAGSLLRTFKTDSIGHNLFSCIFHLTFSLTDSCICIVDQDNGLITLDAQGNKLSVVTDKRLKTAFGVSAGEIGQLFVCDYSTGSVYKLNKHNGALHEILAQSDGIQKPVSVTFIQKLNQLVVACYETNAIKVFQLI